MSNADLTVLVLIYDLDVFFEGFLMEKIQNAIKS